MDTCGAGDCFTAAFGVKLAEGEHVGDAMEFANKAAFLSITKVGAIPSMPKRAEVEKF